MPLLVSPCLRFTCSVIKRRVYILYQYCHDIVNIKIYLPSVSFNNYHILRLLFIRTLFDMYFRRYAYPVPDEEERNTQNERNSVSSRLSDNPSAVNVVAFLIHRVHKLDPAFIKYYHDLLF